MILNNRYILILNNRYILILNSRYILRFKKGTDILIKGKCSSEDANGKFLVFVDRQEAADSLMSQLMKRGTFVY